MRACKTCTLVIISLLLTGCGNSIWDLARWGKTDEVRATLERDASTLNARNELEKTPLFFSVTFDQPEVTTLLLDKGADIAARDRTGLTALHAAAWMNRDIQAGLLLERGAEIDAQDNFGDTALHVAAYRERPQIYVYLLKRGANPDAKNKAGLSPMELAQKSLAPDRFSKFQTAVNELLAESAGVTGVASPTP